MSRMLYVYIAVVLVGVTQALSLSYETDDFFPTDDVNGDAPGLDYNIGRQKRFSPNCRRCMFRLDDWTRCWGCYTRPGPVPFYGGFDKRSIFPGDQRTHYYGEGFPYVKEKRSWDACRCCLLSPTSDCCASCKMTPFYGGYKRSVEKRGYETSFAPIGDSGMGLCDSCCNGLSFDFYCCMFSCGDKRRK